jgi:hypothetical protein
MAPVRPPAKKKPPKDDRAKALRANLRTIGTDMQHEVGRRTSDVYQELSNNYRGRVLIDSKARDDAAAIRKQRTAAMRKKTGGVRDRSAAARKGALTRKARGK